MSPPNTFDAAADAGQPPDDERAARAATLATAFAIGDLDDRGLGEFFALLSAPGDEGRAAARVAWEVLGTTTALRTQLGTSFQDTVSHRLDELARPANEGAGGFVDTVRSRLGLARPGLASVGLPEARDAASSRGPVGLICFVVAGALVVASAIVLTLLAGGQTHPAVAEAVRVRGSVSVEGRPVSAGAPLDRRPVVIGDGGRLVVGWSRNHRATVDGPALVTPQGTGISLASGTAWIETAGAFTAGLPDITVRSVAPAKYAAAISESRSTVGVIAGDLTLVRPSDGRETTLAAGSAATGPDTTFVWETGPRWEAVADGVRRLACSAPRAAWRFSARVVLTSLDDAVVFRGIAGAPAVGLRAGYVILRDAPADSTDERPAGGGAPRLVGQRFRLEGAPLLDRVVRLDAPADGRPTMTVTGLDWDLPLNLECPFDVALYGDGRLSEIEFHVGPRPTPPE